MRMHLKPIPLRVANNFIEMHHMHHGPVRGCKFSVGCYVGMLLVGVVVVERPKARYLDDGYTLEVSRVCTTGQRNVASKLIAAATRAAFAMGARRLIAYVLASEDGTSFRAASWIRVEDASGPVEFGGGEWSRPSRPREPMESPIDKKHRWERYNVAALDDVRQQAA